MDQLRRGVFNEEAEGPYFDAERETVKNSFNRGDLVKYGFDGHRYIVIGHDKIMVTGVPLVTLDPRQLTVEGHGEI